VIRLCGLVAASACGRVGFDALPSAPDAPPLPYNETVLLDHPVAYYRLDEPSGMVATDSSGHGNDGTYTTSLGGSLSYGRPGALLGDADASLGMSGDGNPGIGGEARLDLPFDPFGADFTIEVWLDPLAAPTMSYDSSIFVYEQYLVSGFRTGWTDQMLPEIWTNQTGGTADVRSATPLVIGQWHHVVMTKAGGTATIYLQGAVVAAGALDYVAPAASGTQNCLGACEGLPSMGVFDELAIYDYALPAARIAAHYAAR
jgi:hypothetical protein